jgi:hypothetical protein
MGGFKNSLKVPFRREIAFKKEAPKEPKNKIFSHYKHVTPLELEVDGVSLTL